MTNNDTTPRTRRNMSHADCEHPATTDARTACRESAKLAGTWPLPAPMARPVDPTPNNLLVGSGVSVHAANDDVRPTCGAGRTRTTMLDVQLTDMAVTCKNCLKLINN